MNYKNFKFTDNSYLILCTKETYSRTDSGKSWRSKPDETETETITPEHYTNYITAIPFFNNFGYGAYCRATFSYTIAGYLPTTVISVSPGQTTKIVTKFKFKEV